jgi:hypothetical protein
MVEKTPGEQTQGPSPWFSAKLESFSSRFKALTPTPQSAFSIVGRICASVSHLFTGFKTDRKWGVHVSAEHMAQGGLSGNPTATALKNTIEYLKQSGADKAQILAEKLTYAMNIEKRLRSPKTAPRALEEVKTAVQDLPENESLLICTDSRGHATISEIQCTGTDPNGKKRYSVIVYNTGGGQRNHHSQMNNDGKLRYQTSFEIQNVSEESLCGKTSGFFSKIYSARSQPTEYFYTAALPSLDGTLAPARVEEQRVWSHGQLGGSCTASCLLAFIRPNMSPEEFKEFRDSIRMEMLLKTYEQAQAGKASSHTINAAQEIARKLLTRREAPEISEALAHLQQANPRTARKGLLGQLTARKKETPSADQKNVSTPAMNALSEVLQDMKNGGVHTPERHQARIKTLIQADLSLEESLPDKGKNEVEQLAAEMTEFIKSEPILTKDEVYLYNAMISILQRAAKKYGIEDEELREFKSAHTPIISTYLRMSKKDQTIAKNEKIDEIIDEYTQKVFATSPEVRFEKFKQANKLFLNPLSDITDKDLAIAATKRRLQEPECQRASIIGELIARRDVPLSETFHEISLEGLEGDPTIISALLERVKTDVHFTPSLNETEAALFSAEFRGKLQHALKERPQHLASEPLQIPQEQQQTYEVQHANFFKKAEEKGISLFRAQVFADSCARQYIIRIKDADSVPEGASEAKQFLQHIAEEYTNIYSEAYLGQINENQSVDFATVDKASTKKADMEIQAKYKENESEPVKDAVQRRLQTEANRSLGLSPEETVAYQKQYTNFFAFAQRMEISWFEANLYADLCARKFIAKMREAHTGGANVENNIHMASEYVQLYSEALLGCTRFNKFSDKSTDFEAADAEFSKQAESQIRTRYESEYF